MSWAIVLMPVGIMAAPRVSLPGFVTEYFKTVFLKIPLSANCAGFHSDGHIYIATYSEIIARQLYIDQIKVEFVL